MPEYEASKDRDLQKVLSEPQNSRAMEISSAGLWFREFIG